MLAFTTGGVAGLAGSFVVAKAVWSCAQKQGETADEWIAQMHAVSGVRSTQPPARQVSTHHFGKSLPLPFSTRTLL